MGATGVPFPSATHAADLARLGLEMGTLLVEACAAIGVEPGRLRVRVGLHSGPVISGVLRADRARFQMFGDTGAWARSAREGPL